MCIINNYAGYNAGNIAPRNLSAVWSCIGKIKQRHWFQLDRWNISIIYLQTTAAAAKPWHKMRWLTLNLSSPRYLRGRRQVVSNYWLVDLRKKQDISIYTGRGRRVCGTNLADNCNGVLQMFASGFLRNIHLKMAIPINGLRYLKLHMPFIVSSGCWSSSILSNKICLKMFVLF